MKTYAKRAAKDNSFSLRMTIIPVIPVVLGLLYSQTDIVDNFKEKLKELTSEAFQKDIFGAPTFVVNNKIFWGQDRLEYAIDEYNS